MDQPARDGARSRADLGERPRRRSFRCRCSRCSAARPPCRRCSRERSPQLVDGTRSESRGARVRVARLSRRRRVAGSDDRVSVRACAELAATAAAASPGQRYLLERKLDGEKTREMRAVTQRDRRRDRRRALAVARASRPSDRRSHASTDAAGDARHDGAERRVSRRAGPLERVSKTLTALVERARGAGLSLRLHRPVAAVSFRRASEPMAADATHDEQMTKSTTSSSSSAICSITCSTRVS